MKPTTAEMSRARSVPVPERMARLPVCPMRGIPALWFAPIVDGKPEFRMADAAKRQQAVDEQLCWLCGEKLVPPSVFVIGPMCGLNRISAEPPCHPECAVYAAMACPFLTRPRMDRRDHEAVAAMGSIDGVMIARNPNCCALWTTKGYMTVPDGRGGWLINVGEPHKVTWWSQGRKATRAEVLTSIITGLPHLEMPSDKEVWEELANRWIALDPWLPRE